MDCRLARQRSNYNVGGVAGRCRGIRSADAIEAADDKREHWIAGGKPEPG